MIQITDKRDCCGCTTCAERCPTQCITMEGDDEGFLYPVADPARCIECGLCEKVCQVIHPAPFREPLKTFAALNLDESVRLQSSSGGLFTLLAREVLNEGGVVFGAAFDPTDWTVHHIAVTDEAGLALLRGSKYLQSRLGTTFAQAQKALREGRRVLFSGTSCQIAGLHHYLRRKYDNLLTFACLCHGVPSPMIWQRYLNEVAAGRTVSGVSFRDKRHSWKGYDFSLTFTDGSALSMKASANIFMRGFLSDIYLRPSCERCPARNGSCCSDLAVGDYWGIERLQPEMDDDKGTSIILAYTDKGLQALGRLAPQIRIEEADLEGAKPFNGCFKDLTEPHPARERFFAGLPQQPSISRWIERCIRPSFPALVKGFIRRILSAVKRRLIH